MRALLLILCLIVGVATAPSARADTICEAIDEAWSSLATLRKLQASGDPQLQQRFASSIAAILATQDEGATHDYAAMMSESLAAGMEPSILLATALAMGTPGRLDQLGTQRGCAPSSVASQAREDLELGGNAPATASNALPAATPDAVRRTAPAQLSETSRQGPRFIRGVLFDGDLFVFFAMLAGLLALPVILYLRRTSRAYLQREARQLLFRPVRIRLDDRETDATLVDLSMNGFKLRHAGVVEGTPKLFIQLDGSWVPAVVRWSNDQFAGAKFHRPISLSVMEAVMGEDGIALAA